MCRWGPNGWGGEVSDWERKAYDDLVAAEMMLVTAVDQTDPYKGNRLMTFEEWSNMMQKMDHEENGGSIQ